MIKHKSTWEKSMPGKICFWMFILVLSVMPSMAYSQQDAPPATENRNAAIPQVQTSPFENAAPGEKKPIEITLDNMDIYPVLDYILGGILGLNYVVDPAIKGTISVKIRGEYSRAELLNLLNSILQIHGIALTRNSQGLYMVVRKANSGKVGASDVIPPGHRPMAPGDVVQVFQLHYLSAIHAAANLRNFVSPGATLVPVTSLNSLILVDTADNVKKVGKILSLMDTNLFKDIYWRVYSLEYTDVEDMARDLNKIFGSGGLYMRQGMDRKGLQILPLKTINSLLVVTRWNELLKLVDKWIRELDQGQSDKGTRVYVYFVQNGKASELADLLKQLYTGKAASEKGHKKVLVEKVKEARPAQSAAGELSEKVEIIPDEANNALLIKASPKDYRIIKNVLAKIDVVPRQVLIDVLIAEVTLDKTFQYGVEWFLKSHSGAYSSDIVLTDTNIQKTLSENTPLGTGLGGFSYTLYSAGDLRNLITMLASKTKVNILSAPNILAVDNKESKIEVTQDVPIATSSTTSTTESTLTQSIQYRNAGVILNVTPSINESGLVSMKVTQEVSEPTEKLVEVGGKDNKYPSFTTRKATTNLVVQDGHTIAIGGLMKNVKKKDRSGIPILKDLPILGHLFGWRSYSNTKTELLITITPHVIKSMKQADALTREFSQRVKAVQEMLKKNQDIAKRPGFYKKDNKKGMNE